MPQQREPARNGVLVLSGALNVVIGVLFAASSDADKVLRVVGVVLVVVGILTILSALRALRRERSRTAGSASAGIPESSREQGRRRTQV